MMSSWIQQDFGSDTLGERTRAIIPKAKERWIQVLPSYARIYLFTNILSFALQIFVFEGHYLNKRYLRDYVYFIIHVWRARRNCNGQYLNSQFSGLPHLIGANHEHMARVEWQHDNKYIIINDYIFSGWRWSYYQDSMDNLKPYRHILDVVCMINSTFITFHPADSFLLLIQVASEILALSSSVRRGMKVHCHHSKCKWGLSHLECI